MTLSRGRRFRRRGAGENSGRRGAGEALAFACAIIRSIRAFAQETDLDVQVRVGIHTGPVVGGVVGVRGCGFVEDVWLEQLPPVRLAQVGEAEAGLVDQPGRRPD